MVVDTRLCLEPCLCRRELPGRRLGRVDCCIVELTWHSAEAQLQGWVQHQLRHPSGWFQENPTAASTLSIPDLTQNSFYF